MKSETLIYGEKLLIMLDKNYADISFKQLEEKTDIKGNELRELLKYLKEKEYIFWKMPLFIGNLESEVKIIDKDKINISSKGMEVVLGKRDYFNDSKIIHNLTNVTNSSQVQVAQAGDNSAIFQTIDNSQIKVLKQLIECDEELDEPKKKKLFGILEKFNTLKDGGENALELIKQVGGIALKYVPLFFSLLH